MPQIIEREEREKKEVTPCYPTTGTIVSCEEQTEVEVYVGRHLLCCSPPLLLFL